MAYFVDVKCFRCGHVSSHSQSDGSFGTQPRSLPIYCGECLVKNEKESKEPLKPNRPPYLQQQAGLTSQEELIASLIARSLKYVEMIQVMCTALAGDCTPDEALMVVARSRKQIDQLPVPEGQRPEVMYRAQEILKDLGEGLQILIGEGKA